MVAKENYKHRERDNNKMKYFICILMLIFIGCCNSQTTDENKICSDTIVSDTVFVILENGKIDTLIAPTLHIDSRSDFENLTRVRIIGCTCSKRFRDGKTLFNLEYPITVILDIRKH